MDASDDTSAAGPAPEERFAAVHAACHDTVYRYLARRIIPAHLAEDLTGEVFVIVWEKVLGGAQPEIRLRGGHCPEPVARRIPGFGEGLASSAAPWLMSTAPEGGEPAGGPGTGDVERTGRELLLLTYWDSFTTEEIAIILDSSPGAIRVRLHRARKAFAAALASDSHPHSSRERRHGHEHTSNPTAHDELDPVDWRRCCALPTPMATDMRRAWPAAVPVPPAIPDGDVRAGDFPARPSPVHGARDEARMHRSPPRHSASTERAGGAPSWRLPRRGRSGRGGGAGPVGQCPATGRTPAVRRRPPRRQPISTPMTPRALSAFVEAGGKRITGWLRRHFRRPARARTAPDGC